MHMSLSNMYSTTYNTVCARQGWQSVNFITYASLVVPYTVNNMYMYEYYSIVCTYIYNTYCIYT